MPLIRNFLLILSVLMSLIAGASIVAADEQTLTKLVLDLNQKSFNKKGKAVDALVASGDARVAEIVTALAESNLYVRKTDNKIYIIKKGGDGFLLTDAVTGADAGTDNKKALKKIKTNNKLRRKLSAVLGKLTLLSEDDEIRLKAAQAVLKSRDITALETLEKAIEQEKNADIKEVMQTAQAATVAGSDRPIEQRVVAIEYLELLGGNDVLAILTPLTIIEGQDEKILASASRAIKNIKSSQSFWNVGQNVLYGLSLGSVLLLAAIGLAITFGVMGVINMAHGEMVMIGAYVTFMVQDVIRTSAPSLFDYSLFLALPAAFLVAGGIGVIMERGIIRYLYGRPLETLLATWGVSLILQQAVRTIFGPNNREVGNPSFMSGSIDFGQLTLTLNRFYIILFALAVFAVLFYVMRRTSFGLQMRAVVQNRRMAGSMGIRTKWVDSLTFGLGSGIAGIAGVALSQIDNVSPNLGQTYIVDSFMVVVFGGVGSLWGTLVGAFSLGIANKFLEPYAGAVLGKILVLVFIILFIQKRPRGLFALKGRAVDQ
ncbi:MAG: urea ABC transporter permease subunit UrtB [Hyphomicrobiales bacterium]